MLYTLPFSKFPWVFFFFFTLYVLLPTDWMVRGRVMILRKYLVTLVLEECWGVLSASWWKKATGDCKFRVQEAGNWLMKDAPTLKSWTQWRPIYKKLCYLASWGCLQLQVNIRHCSWMPWVGERIFIPNISTYGFPPRELSSVTHF